MPSKSHRMKGLVAYTKGWQPLLCERVSTVQYDLVLMNRWNGRLVQPILHTHHSGKRSVLAHAQVGSACSDAYSGGWRMLRWVVHAQVDGTCTGGCWIPVVLGPCPCKGTLVTGVGFTVIWAQKKSNWAEVQWWGCKHQIQFYVS